MAAAAAAATAAAAAAGSIPARARFRGCLLGALLGDCLGGRYEGSPAVPWPELRRFVEALGLPRAAAGGGSPGATDEPETFSYSDDTAMSHSLVKSLMAKQDFDEVDMARRFAEEYERDPGRDYGAGVVTVFKKLLKPKCRDVFEPARQQFNGKGSYGNGGAMRVAGIALAYPSVRDVKKFAKLSAQLTHANSLGYNGAILQALAVHYALQGDLDRDTFLEQLIGHMEEVEADEKSVADAQLLGYEELPFSKRLKKIKELLEQSNVATSDVVLELGNGIAALHSVPTAIYSFLRCMEEAHPEMPGDFSPLQRTVTYCIALGGDTDTIATMAGAIAGAYGGEQQVPSSWKRACESFEEAEKLADGLYELYGRRA